MQTATAPTSSTRPVRTARRVDPEELSAQKKPEAFRRSGFLLSARRPLPPHPIRGSMRRRPGVTLCALCGAGAQVARAGSFEHAKKRNRTPPRLSDPGRPAPHRGPRNGRRGAICDILLMPSRLRRRCGRRMRLGRIHAALQEAAPVSTHWLPCPGPHRKREPRPLRSYRKGSLCHPLGPSPQPYGDHRRRHSLPHDLATVPRLRQQHLSLRAVHLLCQVRALGYRQLLGRRTLLGQ